MASSSRGKSSPSPENSDIEGDDHTMIGTMPQSDPRGAAVGTKPRLDKAALQDKNRVKRKKAKRACNNCQRAHLTCDDNRPCERCIARGLSHDCQDGVRKKAKYLHDAPDEALRPSTRLSTDRASSDPANVRRVSSFPTVENDAAAQPKIPDIHRQNSYPFSQNLPAAAPMVTQIDNGPQFDLYGGQNQPQISQYSPQQQPNVSNYASDPMQSMSASAGDAQQFSGGLLDPNDPTLFNFDLASMNFGNHYGALEFGMLSHMSSGFNDPYMQSNQRQNSSASYDTSNLSNAGFVESPGDHNGFTMGAQKSQIGWPSNQGSGTIFAPYNTDQDSMRHAPFMGPYGYTIGNGQPSISELSPGSTTTDRFGPTPFADVNSVKNPPQANDRATAYGIVQSPPLKEEKGSDDKRNPAYKHANGGNKLDKLPQAPKVSAKRRRRDPSTIYSAVTKPYPYTAGFHKLVNVLQRRFSSQKRLVIAQALASIRPSFISCTRTLIDQDLILMERCFQRQLFEYEDFVNSCGTPTLICRRTGEIAYVGEEFTTLTGWRKEVLLGKEPNANINKPIENRSGTVTASSSRGGFNTPRVTVDGTKLDQYTVNSGSSSQSTSENRYQAVFLAELLDDDSVVQFYEDFAKLAFADSKGKAISPCKLLKYKTKEDTSSSSSSANQPNLSPLSREFRRSSSNSSTVLNPDYNSSPCAGNNAGPKSKNSGGRTSQVSKRMKSAKSPSNSSSTQTVKTDADASVAVTATALKCDAKNSTSKSKASNDASGSNGDSGGRRHTLLISGEEALQRLGEPEGKIDCMYCWTVKRDVFDIPMLVVINFLPIVSDWPDGP